MSYDGYKVRSSPSQGRRIVREGGPGSSPVASERPTVLDQHLAQLDYTHTHSSSLYASVILYSGKGKDIVMM